MTTTATRTPTVTDRIETWLRAHWIELALGLVVALLGALELQHPYFWGWERVGGVVVIATAVAVALCRIAPGVGIALAWSTLLLDVLTYFPVLTTQALVIVVAFGAARWGRPPTVWIAAASIPVASLLVVILAMLRTLDLPPLLSGIAGILRDIGATFDVASLVGVTLVGFALLGIPWMAGYAIRIAQRARTATEAAEGEVVQAREEQDRARETAMLRAEQARLARDVHDVVGHSLTVILAQAESGQYLRTKADLQRTLATVADSARSSLGEIRRVLSATHGDDVIVPDLDDLVESAHASHPGLVAFERGEPRELTPALRSTAYRVLQEMLTNAFRHGDRERALEIHREWDADPGMPGLTIEVRNGILDPSAEEHEGRGLTGMRERIAAVDGRLIVQRLGDTFTIRAWIPAR